MQAVRTNQKRSRQSLALTVLGFNIHRNTALLLLVAHQPVSDA
jgi:hypothetical protein